MKSEDSEQLIKRMLLLASQVQKRNRKKNLRRKSHSISIQMKRNSFLPCSSKLELYQTQTILTNSNIKSNKSAKSLEWLSLKISGPYVEAFTQKKSGMSLLFRTLANIC